MTVDISTLAIRIDSMEAREAVRNLDRLSGAGKRAEQQADALSGVMAKLASVMATLKVIEFANSLIESQREFDKLNASLITATGSAKNAGQAFAALQSFAASTPYGLAEVTKAFIQLRNLGLTPSERALNSYGNTAAAMGKSLNQMVEAVADAATGEFERLKEFGIKAKQNGDVVSLTFQGVTANIKNNSQAIERYLIGLGETKFAGGMELQAKTLDGAISNLGDAWDGLKRTISQSGFGEAAHSGVLKLSDALGVLTDQVKNGGPIVEGLKTSAKVAAAYFTLFIAAPAAITAASRALAVLYGVIGTGVARTLGATTATQALNTAIWGTSVSAQIASGALTKLQASASVLFALFSGWQIGTLLREQFAVVRIAGLAFVGQMLKGWEMVKYGAELAWAGVTFSWNKSINTMKGVFADYLSGVAKGLSLIGATDTSKSVSEYVEQLRSAANSQKTFSEETAGLTAAHEKELAFIDKNITELVQFELKTQKAADTTTKATGDQLAQYAVKQAAAGQSAEAIKKEMDAYTGLITSIRSSIAENRIELAVGAEATESQKTSIRVTQELASGKLKLGAAHLEAVRAALAEQAVTEQLLKTQQAEKDVLGFIVQSTQARLESKDALAAEYATYGQSADAREVALVALRNEAEVEKFLMDQRRAGKPVTDEMVGQLKLEAQERTKVEQATMAQSKALGYARQLADENKRFAAESIIDERDRAAAILEIDAAVWRQRIEIAGEGTEAQKKLQEQYVTWYANQTNKPMIDQWRESVKTYDDIFRKGFADMVNNGKSGWASFTKSLTTTFKTSVADQLYKMFAQPFVVNLVGNMLGLSGGAGVAAANGAAGAAGSALTGGAIGATLGAIGSGAFQTAGAVLSGQIGLFDTIGAGFSALSTGTMSGLTAGMSSLAGTLGPIALGVAGIMALVNKWDTSGTIHTGGAASASAAGVSNISASTLGFQPINTADATNKLTSQLASSVVSMLDSTATAFGKTAGYTAATAFADDTSKDGAWGALIISNMNGLVSQWGDANSRWAPKVFSDGEAGQKEYLSLLSSSVRSALDGIGLPAWAKTMLDGLGNAPSLEELAKVVDTINATQSALAVMGQRLKGFAGLTEDAINELIKAAGGVDKLASAASSYYDAYYSDSEKTAVITKQVADALKAVGLQMPTTRDEYRAMLEQQLALGTSGAVAAAALLKNAEAYAKVVPAVENSTTSLEAAKSALNEAYSAESDAIKTVITNTQDYVKTLTGLRDSLMIGDLSPLTPQEQYAEAARQYEATRSAALSGDAAAQSNLPNAITAWLRASRTVNASSDQYKEDFAKAQADLAIAIANGKSQVTTAEASLIALNKQVTGLVTVNESVLSVSAAIKQLATVMGESGKAAASSGAASSITSLYQALLGRAPDAGGMQFWTTALGNGTSISEIANAFMQSPEYMSLHGSHRNGLAYVPFNGYRAELHEGEGVLTASENLNYRAFGAGASTALVAEIKALRDEVTKLRSEQAQQTGALIASNFKANADAAETVATATTDAAQAAAWESRTAPTVI